MKTKRSPAELVFAFWPVSLFVLAAALGAHGNLEAAGVIGGFGLVAVFLWEEFWTL